MTSSKPLIVVAATLAALASAHTAGAQSRPSLTIAYVSMQKIFAEAEDAKAAAKQIEALRATKTQELNAKRQALEQTRVQLVNSNGIFSGPKRIQLAALAQRQETELQQATQQAQAEFLDLGKKTQEKILSEVAPILAALSAERKVLYVLNQDTAVVFAPSAANWTADVLERLNAASAHRSTTDQAAPKNTPPKP
jgi:Skp family chaperone for outer membrane proteins